MRLSGGVWRGLSSSSSSLVAASSSKPLNYFVLNQEILNCSSAREIEQFVLRNGELNEVNLATAFRSMARHRSTSQAAFDKLLAISATAPHLPPRVLSTICHSFATGRYFNKVPGVFVQRVESADLASFTPQSISNTLWTFAAFNQKHPGFFHRVGDHVAALSTGQLEEFSPQAVSNTAWAFATLECNHAGMFAKLSRDICENRDLSRFDLQDLTNIAWAFATLEECGNDVGALFQKMGDEIVTRRLRGEDGTAAVVFSPQFYSNVSWAFAKANCEHAPLFRMLSRDIVAASGFVSSDATDTHDDRPPHVLAKLTPQGISNICWAFAKRHSAPWRRSMDGEEENLAKLFDVLAGEILRRDLRHFTAQGLSNICWAFAKTEHDGKAVFHAVARELTTSRPRDLRDFTLQNLSNVAWAFAKAKVCSPAMLDRLAEELLTRGDVRGDGQCYSNILWAFASCGHPHVELTNKLVGEMLLWPSSSSSSQDDSPLESFTPQAISIVLWSLASLQVVANLRGVLRRFADVIIRRNHHLKKSVDRFDAQDMSNICWALATLHLQQQPPPLKPASTSSPAVTVINAFADHLAATATTTTTGNLGQCDAQTISNLVWALAKLGVRHEGVLSTIAAELKSQDGARLATFAPQAISNTLFSFASLDHVDAGLCRVFANHLLRITTTADDDVLSEYSSHTLANLLWAFSAMRYKDDALVTKLVDEIELRGLASVSALSCSTILLALASLEHACAPDLVNRLVGKLVEASGGGSRNDDDVDEDEDMRLTSQCVFNTMWALACLDAFSLEQVTRWFALPRVCVSSVTSGGDDDDHKHHLERTDAHAQQLLQTRLAWNSRPTSPHHHHSPLLDWTSEGGWADSFALANHRRAKSSRVHLKISRMLEEHFTAAAAPSEEEMIVNEAVLLDGVSVVDIFVPRFNAVVEVDGPTHFFANQPTVLTGNTRFKHRLLRNAGFQLHVISVREFSALSPTEQHVFVRALYEKIVS